MKKEHQVFTIIHKMTSKEKSFFKKNQLFQKNESNSNLKIIFDILNKQKEYSIDDLLKEKKLSSSVKKGIHVWLNTLTKKIVNALIDYKMSKSNVNVFFKYINEYDLFIEMGLNDLADKKINIAEKFADEKDLFYLKPFVYEKMNKKLLNNVNYTKEYKKAQNDKYEESVLRLSKKAEINILSSKFENIIERNNSYIFKDSKLKNELARLKEAFENTLLYFNNKLRESIAINNNILIINMILENVPDIKKQTSKFVNIYTNNQKYINNEERAIGHIFLNNLANYNLLLGNTNEFNNILEIFDADIKLVKEKNILIDLNTYRTNLKSLFYFIKPKEKVSQKDLEYFIETLENSKSKDRAFYELITTTSIILANQKKYKQSLDLTSEINISDFNEKISDPYVFIKLTRAICWLKLENIDLFNSELQSVYKFLLKHQNFSYAKEITNFIKKITKEKLMTNRKKHLLNLSNKFEEILKDGTLYEKMEAIELQLLLKIAL